MSESRCSDGAHWCARADEMFNAPGLHVLEVVHDGRGLLVVTVETDEVVTGCRSWGVVAVATAGGSTWCTTLRRSGPRC